MKKIVIVIIVILSLLLVFQLAYYNFTKRENNKTSANSIGNQTIGTSEDNNVLINVNNTNNLEETMQKQENIVILVETITNHL